MYFSPEEPAAQEEKNFSDVNTFATCASDADALDASKVILNMLLN